MRPRYTGLALPAVRTAGGYFVSKRDIDVVWGSVILAIMTPVGSRWMNRSYGSHVAEVLFEPTDAVLVSALTEYINDAASKFATIARITRVDVQVDRKTVSIVVTFSNTSDSRSTTDSVRAVKVDRRSTIQFLSARSR